MDRIIRKIEGVLLKSVPNGHKRLTNGTRLFGRAPEIGPEAWYHLVFAPLNTSQIRGIEKALHQSLPGDFEFFLNRYNGISMFGNQINIWGKRSSWNRSGNNIWQPFDIVSHNRPGERPKGSPYTIVYFGSVSRGNRWVFFQPSNGTVGRTDRRDYLPECLWPDFESWMLDELAQFDSDWDVFCKINGRSCAFAILFDWYASISPSDREQKKRRVEATRQIGHKTGRTIDTAIGWRLRRTSLGIQVLLIQALIKTQIDLI